MPVVAGAATLSYRRFILWDAPSALAWSATVASTGYLFGDDIADIVDRIGAAVSLVVILGLLTWWFVRRWRQPATT